MPTKRKRVSGVQNLNTTTILRKELAQAVGKVCAYRNTGNLAMQKGWASVIVNILRKHELIP